MHKSQETRFVLDKVDELGNAKLQNSLMTRIDEFEKLIAELDKNV